MVTREIVKNEIDKIKEEHLSILLEIIRAFEYTQPESQELSWKNWVEEMYGCCSDEPLQRYPS